MSSYHPVREIKTLAETINLLREWLSTDTYYLGKYGHDTGAYKAILHYGTEECGDLEGHLCLHGIWKCETRLGACDNYGWWKGHVLHGGRKFIDWAGTRNLIVDTNLLIGAAQWEAQHNWWRPPAVQGTSGVSSPDAG